MAVPETEGRNFEAVLDLLAGGRLTVSDLVTRTFGIAEAAAYRLIEQHTEPCLAVRLTYRGSAMLSDPDVKAVVTSALHDTHADPTSRALTGTIDRDQTVANVAAL